jgi:beta-lactamase superfamily II metal-dependent hydrolase
MPDEIAYLSAQTARADATDGKDDFTLLWGDRARVLRREAGRAEVHARDREGWIDEDAIEGGQRLLELYFIDVGQGDGVLISFPDGKHVMIDGGYKRTLQPTGKSGADFVDWKFVKDYERDVIDLDAVIASHCDADHYGGLWDLFTPDEPGGANDLDAGGLNVGTFYHAGVGWWTNAQGNRTVGARQDGELPVLLEDRASLALALGAGIDGFRLQGQWKEFLQAVFAQGCPVERLQAGTSWLPGFGEARRATSGSVRVLAPVETRAGFLPALASDNDVTTNGNSVVLRVEYKDARILLTGDLNKQSHDYLLQVYGAQTGEFLCDVGKACHHGSHKVSLAFMERMNAAATVFSSGDNEGHAHPRPEILGAAGVTGYVERKGDRMLTPLMYSTELARSINLGLVERIVTRQAGGPDLTLDPAQADARVHYRTTMVGDLQGRAGFRALKGCYVVGGVLYGLVNVRTDGKKILCAVRNEKNLTWDVNVFESRFGAA